jgi:iron complex transport system substrate-binding protein
MAMILVAAIAAVGAVPRNIEAAPFAIENGRTIRDQAGRRVTARTPFDRIISLYGAHTENLFALGLQEEIIGVTRNEVYPPRALEKPTFSYHNDTEKFLAARPDLVLIRPMIDRGYPQLVKQLEYSGITVVSLQPTTVDELFTYWRALGILTGRTAQAEQMIRDFQTAVAMFESMARGISPKKRVYFEAIHSKMKTFSPDSMAIFALQTAGGINVAADADPVRQTNIAYYGKERILSKADRIDVYLAQYGRMNQPSLEAIRSEPGFDAIEAVRDNRICLIDEMIVSRPTMRLLEGIYAIGRCLYPDVYDETVGAALQGVIDTGAPSP